MTWFGFENATEMELGSRRNWGVVADFMICLVTKLQLTTGGGMRSLLCLIKSASVAYMIRNKTWVAAALCISNVKCKHHYKLKSEYLLACRPSCLVAHRMSQHGLQLWMCSRRLCCSFNLAGKAIGEELLHRDGGRKAPSSSVDCVEWGFRLFIMYIAGASRLI
jgi:hypothetical protein